MSLQSLTLLQVKSASQPTFRVSNSPMARLNSAAVLLLGNPTAVSVNWDSDTKDLVFVPCPAEQAGAIQRTHLGCIDIYLSALNRALGGDLVQDYYPVTVEEGVARVHIKFHNQGV